jgi:hypothetical protein
MIETDTKADQKESQRATHGSAQNRVLWDHRVVPIMRIPDCWKMTRGSFRACVSCWHTLTATRNGKYGLRPVGGEAMVSEEINGFSYVQKGHDKAR